MTAPDADPQFVAAVDLIGRSGARNFEISYDDDETPVVWIAKASWSFKDGRPVPKGGETVWDVAAALEPMTATLRLASQVLDRGGTCTHCERPTRVVQNQDEAERNEIWCWYVYDAESESYRRGCEGG